MMAAASAMTAASAANACGGGGCSSGSSGIVAAVELEAQDIEGGLYVDVRIVVGAYKHLSIALQYAGATDTIKCTTFFIVCGVY